MNPLGVVFVIIIIVIKKKISRLMLGSNYHFYENCISSYLWKKICLSRISLPVLHVLSFSLQPWQ